MYDPLALELQRVNQAGLRRRADQASRLAGPRTVVRHTTPQDRTAGRLHRLLAMTTGTG